MTDPNERKVLVVPPIAEGNPAMQEAARRQALQDGLDFRAISLNVVGWLGSHMHAGMTEDPARAEIYSQNSEQERLNLKARLFSLACAGELIGRLGLDREEPSQFCFSQEHPILGLHPEVIRHWLNASSLRVFVPDVYPKESSVEILRRLVAEMPVEFVVWNVKAEKELRELGMPVVLKKPFMLDGFRPDVDEFANGGSELVIKSSGSGMPKAWEDELMEAFRNRDLKKDHVSWAIHTQRRRYKQDQAYPWITNKLWRIEDFYKSLGGETKLFVSFPTELVGVMADMRTRDVPVQMILMPPRGAHEVRNQDFAQRNGLVYGYLAVGMYAGLTEYRGLPVVKPDELEDVVRAQRRVKAEVWDKAVVGIERLWAA